MCGEQRDSHRGCWRMPQRRALQGRAPSCRASPQREPLRTHLSARAEQGEEVRVHDDGRVQRGEDAAHVRCGSGKRAWPQPARVSPSVCVPVWLRPNMPLGQRERPRGTCAERQPLSRHHVRHLLLPAAQLCEPGKDEEAAQAEGERELRGPRGARTACVCVRCQVSGVSARAPRHTARAGCAPGPWRAGGLCMPN